MRAAQNLFVSLLDIANPPALVELITSLPEWLRAALVVVLALLIAARMSVPPLLRAIDAHLDARVTRRRLSRSEDWLELQRIRSQPRRLFGGADPAPAPPPRGAEDDSELEIGHRPRRDGSYDDPAEDPP